MKYFLSFILLLPIYFQNEARGEGIKIPVPIPKPKLRPWTDPPTKGENCCDSDFNDNEPVNIRPKYAWKGISVKKDPSFDCMDYPSMAPLMGYPDNLSNDEILKRVYKGGRILIHHTANDQTALQNQKAHIRARGLQDLAYHFFITKEGDILEARPLTLMGAHAGTLQKKHYTCEGTKKVAFINRDYDFRSVGIVLQGNLEEFEVPEAQYAATRSLVHMLITKFGIDKINGHFHYRPGGTKCPGANMIAKLQDLSSLTPEPPVDKTTNDLGPDFICRYPSSSCGK